MAFKIKYVWFLLAGIVIGFLVGQIGFVARNSAQQSGTQNLSSTQQTQSSQQNLGDQVAVKSKFFENVKNVSADNDPVTGSKDAKLTIIEFTDYQCSYCKKYFDETFPLIKKNYIDTGKVKYVVRDFPLEEHPQALLAAKTANCAGAQNKYWEMHELLFTTNTSWSYNSDAAGILGSYAKNLGLDQGRFDQCMKSKDTTDEIAKDIKDGEIYGVTSTPTFFIGGEKIVGAQPFETVFKTVIDQELT